MVLTVKHVRVRDVSESISGIRTGAGNWRLLTYSDNSEIYWSPLQTPAKTITRIQAMYDDGELPYQIGKQ